MKFIIILLGISVILSSQTIPNIYAVGDFDYVEFSGTYSIVEKESSFFAIVNVETTNTGNTTFDVSTVSFYLFTKFNSQFSSYNGSEMDEYGCGGLLPKVDPGLTKHSVICFEVPHTGPFLYFKIQNYPDALCSSNPCESEIASFSEHPEISILNEDYISQTANSQLIKELENKIKELEKKIVNFGIANKKLQNTVDILEMQINEPNTKKEIVSFVDSTKDPQLYIDKYNNDIVYKEWFDDNYPGYDSIYEAVGKRQPVPDWIKNNAIWWSEGKISEDEFITGIEYLVKEKIIKLN